MLEMATTGLLWGALVGSAMFAGVSWAFSGFVMPGLGRVPDMQGMTAMNAMNAAFVKTMMLPLFILSGVIALALTIVVLFDKSQPGAMEMIIGGLSYLIGMILCTAAIEVPLNNKLMAADPSAPDSPRLWAHYLKAWTAWNTLRTLAALFSFVLFALAIQAR